MKHIDPIGTVVMPLLMMISGLPYLFGWAKPVPFNPVNLGNIRRDPVLIAIAGPASNLIIAILCALAFRVIIMVDSVAPNLEFLGVLVIIIHQLIMINLVLILFNLIPVPPLDGHYVLHYFLPPEGQRMIEQIGPFGIIIAILVARPWISVSMPYMESMILWIATVGLG
jgi:Zn-dependent protease